MGKVSSLHFMNSAHSTKVMEELKKLLKTLYNYYNCTWLYMFVIVILLSFVEHYQSNYIHTIP